MEPISRENDRQGKRRRRIDVDADDLVSVVVRHTDDCNHATLEYRRSL